MSTPVRVAHVITRLDVGGAQATAIRICALLDRERYDPVLIAGVDDGSGGDMRRQAAAAGVEVVDLPSLRSPIRPLADGRAVRDLAALFRDRAPAVVHTHSSKAGALGRLAARAAGTPTVVHTVHGWSFTDTQRRPVAAGYRAVERLLAPRTSALVVVTVADRARGVDARIGDPDRYALVRSGIRLGATASRPRAAQRAQLGWGEGEHVVVSVGRLEPQKDPLLLVEAVARAAAGRAVRLALVGGGSLERAVLDAASRLGVASQVDVLGNRDDVPDLLAAADSFALSSRFEGLPWAILEATDAGLPVIATDVGGVSEVIVDGVTGHLVPAGDVDRLAAALAAVIDDPGRARGLAAAAGARLPAFTEQRMAEDTMALYDGLLLDGRVPRSLSDAAAGRVGQEPR